MRTRFPAARIMGLVLSGCVTLMLAAGCSFLVGTNLDLVPVPENVAVKGLPQILSCEARFVEVSSQNTYERVCGCNCWDRVAGAHVWCCRTVWRHTDSSGDLVLRLVVEDPAGDVVPGHAARVHVLDPLPQTGLTAGACSLSLTRKEIQIQRTDIVTDGVRKTVTVRVRGVSVRLTPTCRVRTAVLPIRISFTDGGQQWESVNQIQAVVTVSLPLGAPYRGPNDTVIYTGPHPCPCPHPCP